MAIRKKTWAKAILQWTWQALSFEKSPPIRAVVTSWEGEGSARDDYGNVILGFDDEIKEGWYFVCYFDPETMKEFYSFRSVKILRYKPSGLADRPATVLALKNFGYDIRPSDKQQYKARDVSNTFSFFASWSCEIII